MNALRNFHIVPRSLVCSCALGGCGGIVLVDEDCLEHGEGVRPPDVLKTHFHPVQGAA